MIKRLAWFTVTLAALMMAASAANAITYLKINGGTSANITQGESVVFTCDCTAGDDVILWVTMSTGSQTCNTGAIAVMRDNDFDDENATSGLIQKTVKLDMYNGFPGEVFTFTAYEPATGKSVSCTGTVTASTTSQGVTGYVYKSDGVTPAVNAIVVATCESYTTGGDLNVGGALTDSSGKYTIYLPPAAAGSLLYNAVVFKDLKATDCPTLFNNITHTGMLVSNGAVAAVPNMTEPAQWVLKDTAYTCAVTGTIEDDSEHPLPGVQVGATDAGNVYTDASGHYVYYGTLGDTITPSLANYVPDAVYTVTTKGLSTVSMTMHHGAVQLECTLENSSTSAVIPYMPLTLSGGDFTYQEAANKSGQLSCWVDASTSPTLEFVDNWAVYDVYKTSYTAPASGSTAETVKINPMAVTVTGQVTDNESPSKPVPNVLVSWVLSSGGQAHAVVSDSSGNFSFAAVAGSTYDITFTKNGWYGGGGISSWVVPSGGGPLYDEMLYEYNATTLTTSGLTVTPCKGTTRTTFVVSAVYTDSNNNAPTGVWFKVNGTNHTMTKSGTSTNYAAGVTYTWSGKLPEGVWDFYVWATTYDSSVYANLAPGQPQVMRAVVRPGRDTSCYFGDAAIGCLLGLNSSGNIWENTYGNWTGLPGTFTAAVPADLSGCGEDDVVALDTSGVVNIYANGAWTKSGNLTSIAVGDFNGDGTDGIVGLNSKGQIWVYKSGAWSQVPGNLKQIWVGDFVGNGQDGLVGINSAGQIYYTTNLSTWTKIPGELSGLVVGDFGGLGHDGIAGLNSQGEVWYAETLSGASTTWTEVPGKLQKICAGDFLGTGRSGLAGLNSAGQVWVTTDLNDWTQAPGTLRSLLPGDFTGASADDLAGLNNANQIWTTTNETSWTQMPGSLSILCGRQMMYELPI